MEQIQIQRTYNDIIENISQELNFKGRSKAGESRQENIINLLTELKNSYEIELSIFFLRNLIQGDKRKATFKLRNLTKGLNKSRVVKHSKSLTISKAKAEILLYTYLKNKQYISDYSEVKVFCDIEPLKKAQIPTGEKELISHNVHILDSWTAEVGHQNFRKSQRVFKFI